MLVLLLLVVLLLMLMVTIGYCLSVHRALQRALVCLHLGHGVKCGERGGQHRAPLLQVKEGQLTVVLLRQFQHLGDGRGRRRHRHFRPITGRVAVLRHRHRRRRGYEVIVNTRLSVYVCM